MASANQRTERPTKAFRTDATTWKAFQDKCKKEGVTNTDALNYLIEGFLQGVYVLPDRKLVYPSNSES